jgi:hypothetical protein
MLDSAEPEVDLVDILDAEVAPFYFTQVTLQVNISNSPEIEQH